VSPLSFEDTLSTLISSGASMRKKRLALNPSVAPGMQCGNSKGNEQQIKQRELRRGSAWSTTQAWRVLKVLGCSLTGASSLQRKTPSVG
jgi:hypothetical protein